MDRSFLQRIADLEQAALRFEGAHYAHHDLIAGVLSQLSEKDCQTLLDRLDLHSKEIETEFGPDRILGYREELISIRTEFESNPKDVRSLFLKLRR